MKYTSYRKQLVAKMDGLVDRAIMAAAAVYVERVRASFTLRGRGVSSPPGRPPAVQTGDLRRRLYTRLIGRGVARAGTNSKYGRAQELGGEIVGRNGKLAIPIGERGRRLAKRAGGNLRTLDLRAVRIRGTVMLFDRRGKELGPPVFVLKDSVRLPPRPYLRPMLRRAAADMRRAFENSLRAGMKVAA